MDSPIFVEGDLDQQTVESIKHHYDIQHKRSLQALELIKEQSTERLQTMDAQVLKFDPDISMRIHKPGLAKNGTASIQENFHIDDSGKYRFLETDDALFGAPQIPYPNVLLALNRYTRSTTFREEFIMRIPIFGKNLLGKVVEDDVVEVVELTMSEKTFDALSKAMHQTMWRDDKKYELYKEFHEYGIPENRIPEVAAKNMVAKNMNGLFHKVNERITKSGNA